MCRCYYNTMNKVKTLTKIFVCSCQHKNQCANSKDEEANRLILNHATTNWKPSNWDTALLQKTWNIVHKPYALIEHFKNKMGLEQTKIYFVICCLLQRTWSTGNVLQFWNGLRAEVPKCRTQVCSHSGVVSRAFFRGTMAELLKQMGKLLLSN